MITHTDREISRIPYGSNMLWILHGDLAGSWARRLSDRIGLHITEEKGGLMLDLRDTGFIDSEGASALARSRQRHPGLAVIGRPKDFGDMPLSIREALRSLQPFEGIESAYTEVNNFQALSQDEEKRRLPRIPTQIPVELFIGSSSGMAMVRDINSSGVRLSQVPADLAKEAWIANGDGRLEISGMAADPLGREIAGKLGGDLLSSQAVHVSRGAQSVGASFIESFSSDQFGPSC
jgi:hypothetical protein